MLFGAFALGNIGDHSAQSRELPIVAIARGGCACAPAKLPVPSDDTKIGAPGCLDRSCLRPRCNKPSPIFGMNMGTDVFGRWYECAGFHTENTEESIIDEAASIVVFPIP